MEKLRFLVELLTPPSGCPTPACGRLMRVDVETRNWRCPSCGPMAFADEIVDRAAKRLADGVVSLPVTG
jgi:tRNA(Ile2) C34 agmatinyltransferase TiaS